MRSAPRIIVRNCSLAVIIILFAAGAALAQSTDPDRPTPIAAFPVTGTLSRGTYYYQVLANAGPATMGLTITPPQGGASMSVSLSGPDCCTAEAYVSASAGNSDPIRGASDRFSIPSRQTILLTVYVDVAPGKGVRFSLNYAGAGGSGVVITPPALPPPPKPTPTPTTSGVIITPPPPTPSTPPPPRATPPPCTDLAVEQFLYNRSGSTTTLSGVIRNLSSTAFVSPNRRQYLDVLYISGPSPVSVGRMGFHDVPAGGSIPFSISFPTPAGARPLRSRYRVLIYYNTRALENDRLYTNDDCNAANNSTERQLIGVPTDPP